MGLKTDAFATASLSNVLFSGVQQRVLAILFGHVERSFYANEIARLGNTGKGALQRELGRMTAAGLITLTAIGRQKHYQANKDCPIFRELRAITLKTFGLADVVRSALLQHTGAIRCAFIFGSVARSTDNASSDVDVMIVAEGLTYSDLYDALAKAEETVGRKVNPTLYTLSDFQKRLVDDNHFIVRVISQPVIPLIGAIDALSQPGFVEP